MHALSSDSWMRIHPGAVDTSALVYEEGGEEEADKRNEA